MNSDYMQTYISSIDFTVINNHGLRREFMLYFRLDDPSDFEGRTFVNISEQIGMNALVILLVLVVCSIAFALYAQRYWPTPS